MAFLKLASDNKDLGFILKKNPASGMNARLHKQGRLFGWYTPTNPQVYNVLFKDQGHSYDLEKDYNNLGSLTSPLFVLDAITELFSEVLKKNHEKDAEGVPNSLEIVAVQVHEKTLRVFQENFPEVSVETKDLGTAKKLTLKSSCSLHYLVNYTALLFALFELRKTDLYVDTTLLTKYLHCLNRVQAPYFVRYLFKTSLLRHFKDFEAAKPLLDTSSMKFSQGDNYLARANAVIKRLNRELPVVDVGCGEGRFMNFLHEKVPAYIGVDKDPVEVEKSRSRIQKFEFHKAQVFEVGEAFVASKKALGPYQALLVEVIEHMPLEAATALTKEVLEDSNLQSLFISTPDRSFNSHYHIDTGFRHPDHHYEFTRREFEDWVKATVPVGFNVEFFGIGDSVDGVYTTSGAFLKRVSK